MKRAQIINANNGNILASRAVTADCFVSRLKGLLGKTGMDPSEGLIIYPCSMVHTIGMRMAIDVVFVSEDHEIVHIIEGMRPNRISPHIKKARYVVEAADGQIARTGTLTEHYLIFK